MSSLSVSNLFDITRMTPDLGNCHPDYIQVQPEFMGAAPSWEYGGARFSCTDSSAPNRANIGAKR
jgi:hypothetical protein